MALRLRRGTNAERQTITPLQGELIYVTDSKKLYVGDGATQGGVLVGPVDMTAFDLVNDTSPQLGGDLDLNSNNITGIGNINIDGTITATGNIGLGDADNDTIEIGGVINSSLRPALSDTYSIGSASRRWANIFAAGAEIDQTLTVQNISLNGAIFNSTDSSLIYNASTNSLSVASIVGDLTGSVYSDDSGTVLVDSVAGQITGPVVNSSVTTENIIINTALGGIDIKTEGTLNDDYSLFTISSFHDSSSSSGLIYLHGRGTIENPEPIQLDDTIIDSIFVGISSNGTPSPAAQVNVSVDPAGTVGNSIVPGSYTIATFNDLGDPVVGLNLNRNGAITVADNTATAGISPGDVDDSAPVTYLKITVGATEYALPLYGFIPVP
jgi:hypothetical protein